MSIINRHESMWAAVYRDVENIAALKEEMKKFESYLDQVRDDLLAPWKTTGKVKQHLAMPIRHCLKFTTWQSLSQEKLKGKQLVDLVMSWIG